MAEALLIVDFQNDFTPGGALAVAHGDEIAGRINELANSDRYALVVATRDWHPEDHGSFDTRGGPWPVHCVQGTHGAQLHPALDMAAVHKIVDKGTDPETEGYSAFDGTGLARLLKDRGITKVTVAGLATDYCVKHTVLDALREDFQVEIVPAAMRAVNVSPGDGDRAITQMWGAGASRA